MVKEFVCSVETWIQSLVQEDSPGEGNGYPLQYSCLENSMVRGTWRAKSMEFQGVRYDWETNTFHWQIEMTHLRGGIQSALSKPAVRAGEQTSWLHSPSWFPWVNKGPRWGTKPSPCPGDLAPFTLNLALGGPSESQRVSQPVDAAMQTTERGWERTEKINRRTYRIHV